MTTPETHIELVLEWFDDCAKACDVAGRKESAMLWRDGKAHLIHAIEQRDELLEALKRSKVAIDDWINTYAPEFCDNARVEEAISRLNANGTLAYLADIQEINRSVIAKVDQS